MEEGRRPTAARRGTATPGWCAYAPSEGFLDDCRPLPLGQFVEQTVIARAGKDGSTERWKGGKVERMERTERERNVSFQIWIAVGDQAFPHHTSRRSPNPHTRRAWLAQDHGNKNELSGEPGVLTATSSSRALALALHTSLRLRTPCEQMTACNSKPRSRADISIVPSDWHPSAELMSLPSSAE